MALLDGLNDALKCAVVGQPQPTGNGRIVFLDAFPALMEKCNKENLEFICEHLLKRMGKGFREYGTYLRTDNGRDALQDALDEALDGFMYATQLNMEQPSYDSEQLQQLFLQAAQLCKIIKDGRPTLTQAFAELREKFGDGWQYDNAD